MSPTDGILIDRWIQERDAEAFREIVTRHGGMVYGTCTRILRNGSDAEDVAQECFLKLAQTEANTIQKLGGWLHQLATHRSLNRLRAEGRRLDREKRYGGAGPTHVDDSWDDVQAHVDEAILALPEELSVVVIRHFLEGESKKNVASELRLSPSSVTRRIDRAVAEIREHLGKKGVTMASAAITSVLGNLLSSELPKALAASLGKLALSGRTGHAGATITSGKAIGLPMGLKIGVAVSLLVVAIAFTFLQFKTPNSSEEIDSSASDTVETAASISTSDVDQPSEPVSSNSTIISTVESTTVSGTVVYKKTNRYQRKKDPAHDVRVLLGREFGTEHELLHSVVTGEDGSFTLEGIEPGKFALLAYDARYDEVPEDWLRSEHILTTVVQGENNTDIEIEVPPRGGQVFGRVYDEKTGAPMSGITISASHPGTPFFEGTSDSKGEFLIFGLKEGDWRVRVADENRIFSSDYAKTMKEIFLKPDGRAKMDLALNRGIPVSGRVEHEDGTPFVGGRVHAELYAEKGDHMDCYFDTDSLGKFTVLGANSGDRVVVRAERRDVASHIKNVFPIDGEPLETIVLTVYPKVKVSGHFVDLENGAIEGRFWYRHIHPDGSDGWRGVSDVGRTFDVALAPGQYEIKGITESYEFADEQSTQIVDVGRSTVSNVVLRVRTNKGSVGVFTFSGRLVDESDKPIRNTRVTIRGQAKDNMAMYSQTETDSHGRFNFDGLQDSKYEIHASVSDPFERNPGLKSLNPIESPEIKIVARKAARLTGKVVDASTGDPINQFTIEVGQALQMGNEIRWDKKDLASESGEFNLPAKLDQNWFARVTVDGFETNTLRGPAFASGAEIESLIFEMKTGRVISGLVVDEDGLPIDDAFLYLNDDAYKNHIFHSEDYAAGTTNSVGEFSIKSIPSEATHVFVAKKGFAVEKIPIATNMTIKMGRGGTIVGTLSIGGEIAPEKTSLVASHLEILRSYHWGQTNNDGRFEINELLDGAHYLQVNFQYESSEGPLLFAVEKPVEVKDGMVVTIDVSIPVGTSVIEGTLRDSGVLVPDWPIRAKYRDITLIGKTDQDGRYRFENLPGGEIVIERYIPNQNVPGTWAQEEIAQVVVGAGETIYQDIDIR
jgi:RNA polymerase sigma factor (sigma-70 family)